MKLLEQSKPPNSAKMGLPLFFDIIIIILHALVQLRMQGLKKTVHKKRIYVH